MKGTSLKYLTHEGFRNVWVNRLMSLASVTVLMACLIIMGAGIMIYFNINNELDGGNINLDDLDNFKIYFYLFLDNTLIFLMQKDVGIVLKR